MEARPSSLPALPCDEEGGSSSEGEHSASPAARRYPSTGAVFSTVERREQIRSLVPVFDFGRLTIKTAARPPPKSSYLMPKKTVHAIRKWSK